MKHLFALLVAAILTAGVLSAYAEDATTVPATQGTEAGHQKEIKDVKKTKKHHKHTKKKSKKAKKTGTDAATPEATSAAQ